MSSKALPYVIAALALGAVLIGSYAMGNNHGKAKIRAEWKLDTGKRVEAMTNLQAKYNTLSEEHRTQGEQINRDLSKAKTDHEMVILKLRAEYDQRLLLSTKREGLYQRQAEGSAAERRSLASHAARLDAALEQGRYLVAELRSALEQRESQLRSLGQQIISDRKLFMEVGTPNG